MPKNPSYKVRAPDHIRQRLDRLKLLLDNYTKAGDVVGVADTRARIERLQRQYKF